MKFKFRLQAVLEQRERRETLAQQTLAESQAALGRAEKLLGEMREVRQALLDELCRQRAGAFDAFETQLYQDYMQVITQSIAEQESDIRTLQTSCAAHQLHLIGTARGRRWSACETGISSHTPGMASKSNRRQWTSWQQRASTTKAKTQGIYVRRNQQHHGPHR